MLGVQATSRVVFTCWGHGHSPTLSETVGAGPAHKFEPNPLAYFDIVVYC